MKDWVRDRIIRYRTLRRRIAGRRMAQGLDAWACENAVYQPPEQDGSPPDIYFGDEQLQAEGVPWVEQLVMCGVDECDWCTL